MVSRVYQPVYSNRTPTAKPPASAPSSTVSAEQPTAQVANNDAYTPQRERPDLATLRDQAENGRIRLDSVLTDFETTLKAIGVPDHVSRQMQPYLSVVRLQGQEGKPNVPLIKATLLSASQSLDGFIAQATGKPSNVVEQWMQSLLAQNVDYRAVSAPTPHQAEVALSADQVKQWVMAAKTQSAENAIPLLHQALNAAEDSTIKGRIHYLLAKRYWRQDQPQQATQHLSQSVSLQPDPSKQARQRVLLGHWYQQMNQPPLVMETLTPLWQQNQLETLDPLTQARAKLDYGKALVGSQPEQAIPLLKEGIKQGFGQKAWVRQALPTLASAYLATGDYPAALKTLQRLVKNFPTAV